MRLQGRYSDPFNIEKGTRQGCSLSPLIFAIAIETLAVAIRNHPDIRGVMCSTQKPECALLADDLLLFVTSPLTPNIFNRQFVIASGLQVNVNKSLALNISVPPDLLERLQAHFPFAWSNTSIPYLGVNLASNFDLLHSYNYPHLFKKNY